MKNLLIILMVLLFSSFYAQNDSIREPIECGTGRIIKMMEDKKTNLSKSQICWRGKLNSKTNIFLHYQVYNNIVSGYITYLDTKAKTAIRIIGTIDESQNYRLLEFDKTGNITGIITGSPKNEEFSGTWFSPKTRKELSMSLKKSDDNLKSENIEATPKNIAGDYYYQYGEKGYQGHLTIKNEGQNKISFELFSVTNDPSRNIAEIKKDIVSAETDFVYKVPETDNCEFRVQFFKDYAYIHYTRGFCEGNFGFNATIEGIFYKQKK